jgi:predicted nuclease of predicted toxin-antitoxin system
MMAGFLADECFSGYLVRAMRAVGFDVARSADIAPGASDEHVLALAVAQSRILLTEDNDFGDLVVRLRLPTHGVVRVALKSLDKPHQAARLIKALGELEDKVRDAMVTIEPNRTRIRPLTYTLN